MTFCITLLDVCNVQIRLKESMHIFLDTYTEQVEILFHLPFSIFDCPFSNVAHIIKHSLMFLGNLCLSFLILSLLFIV